MPNIDFTTLRTIVSKGMAALINVLCLMILVGMCAQTVSAREVSQAEGNLTLTQSHGGGEGWGKTKCGSCHALFRLHDTVPKIKTLVEKTGFGSCAGCHGKNGTSIKQQCVICHNNTVMPGVPHRTGKHRHDYSLLKTKPTADDQCLGCHAASDMDGRFELNQDLTLYKGGNGQSEPYANISEFCVRCHTESNPNKKYPIKHAGRRDQALRAETDYRLIDKHGVKDGLGDGANSVNEVGALYYGLRSDQYSYHSIVECVDCHAMHGTTNASNLIIDDSRKAKFFHDEKTRHKAFNKKWGHVKVKVWDKKDFITNPNPDKPPTLSSIVDCSVVKEQKEGNYSQLCVLCHDMKNRSEGHQLTENELLLMGGHCDTGNGLSGVHFNEWTDNNPDKDASCLACHYHGRSGISGL